jgi:hypothetical protein
MLLLLLLMLLLARGEKSEAASVVFLELGVVVASS